MDRRLLGPQQTVSAAPRSRRRWLLPALLALAGVLALMIDLPLARWVAAGHCPDELRKICGLAEVFGHGFGVAAIVLTIYVLDPVHRRMLPRVLAASLGSGIVANCFKLLVARTRPHRFELTDQVGQTFVDWLPLWRAGSANQGFPSSHTAVAVGLAIALVALYPRGRRLFPALAVLAALQRIVVNYHFLSDVFWGAAVGALFGGLCIGQSVIAKRFDRIEQPSVDVDEDSAPNVRAA